MKKILSVFIILQLSFAGFMSTSHMALGGHDIYEKPHFHLTDNDDHTQHQHDLHSDHAGEVHVHLTFIETNLLKTGFVSLGQANQFDHNVTYLNHSFKPLLPPPNSCIA